MRRVRRIVLIVNPYSTGVTAKRVAEVSAALARRAEVVVRQTERRGHATELAAEAIGEADALVVFSGDGTYNEAINGAAGELPFGFLPGGGASVFPARARLAARPGRRGRSAWSRRSSRDEAGRSGSAGSTGGAFAPRRESASMPRRCGGSTGAAATVRAGGPATPSSPQP